MPQAIDSHSAAPSMLGYLYQARYALLRALEEAKHHPSHELSIERLDDVAFEASGRPIELIQFKHHVVPANVSDKGVDLWKTIYIWIKRIVEDPTRVANARLVLITTNTATEGSALSVLRRTHKDRDIGRAVELLVAAAKESRNETTRAPREAFLRLTSEKRHTLVGNIWVFDAAPNIIDVRGEIEEMMFYTAPADRVRNIADDLEGWWFSRMIMALAGSEPRTIHLAEVPSKVSALRERYRLDNLPLDETIDAMPPSAELPHNDRRLFVRQLGLVRIDGNEILGAVHDYHRAFAQRSQWVREHLLLDDAVDRYDRVLCDAWDRRFLEHTADISTDADDSIKEARGREVFRWARQYSKPLRNRDELWLSSGSFQMLADNLRVGWHPSYKRLLADVENDT